MIFPSNRVRIVVASVKLYVRATRPREPVEPVVRFETPAGRQGQVDFGTFTLPWGAEYHQCSR